LEAAALQRNLEMVASNLEHALGISQQLARRMIADERGEPIVVAAKALSIPANVLQRMLLFMNPAVGQSVERVYKLAALHNEMTLAAAQRMIDIWQEAEPAEQRKVPHGTQPPGTQWQSTVRHARQALAEISRHPSAGKAPGAGKRPDTGTETGNHLQRANGSDAR
jgi:hypothetical protein